jgi:hypothetical protein
MSSATKQIGIQVAIGILLLLFGLLLTITFSNSHATITPSTDTSTSHNTAIHTSDNSMNWHSIWHHIGTALLTCGMLMITVELYVKIREKYDHARVAKKQQEHLLQLQNAHNDALLKSLLPDAAIFEQIKSEIIQKPFLRRNMDATVHLKLCPNGHSLIKTLDLSFDLENTSSSIGDSPIRIRLSDDSVGPSKSEIQSLSLRSDTGNMLVSIPNSQNKIQVTQGEELRFDSKKLIERGVAKWEGRELEAYLLVTLNSKQIVKFTYRLVTPEEFSDQFDLLCTHSTVGLNLQVHPDPNIEVTGYFSHPNVQTIRDDYLMKHWSITGALLPYQGITFRWKNNTPKSVKHIDVVETKGISSIAGIDAGERTTG